MKKTVIILSVFFCVSNIVAQTKKSEVDTLLKKVLSFPVLPSLKMNGDKTDVKLTEDKATVKYQLDTLFGGMCIKQTFYVDDDNEDDFGSEYSHSELDLSGVFSYFNPVLNNGLNMKPVEPSWSILKIYADGKEQQFKPNANEWLKSVILSDTKTVDSVRISYTFPYCTEAQVVSLSEKKPVYKTDIYHAFIDSIDGTYALLKLNQAAFQNIVRIEGIDSNGKQMVANNDWTAIYIGSSFINLTFEMFNLLNDFAGDFQEEFLDVSKEEKEPPTVPLPVNFPKKVREIRLFLQTQNDEIQSEIVLSTKCVQQ